MTLRRLLERLEPDPSRDRMILLGDLFDRGPHSWEVLQEVKKLEKSFGERFALLRGNHEDYLLAKQLSFTQKMVWERVGRRTTVKSFRQHGQQMEDSAPWILEHSVVYLKTDLFQCVHAGLKVDPPEANDSYTLMHDHSVVLENRYAGPLVITGHIALDEAMWFAGDGETVQTLSEETWTPLPAYGAICIDTGCGKGGRLTGMIIEGDRFILEGVNQSEE